MNMCPALPARIADAIVKKSDDPSKTRLGLPCDDANSCVGLADAVLCENTCLAAFFPSHVATGSPSLGSPPCGPSSNVQCATGVADGSLPAASRAMSAGERAEL